MAQQLSKADRIRKILHLRDAEIAKRIGCREEYVRSVRQRTSKSGYPILAAADINWRLANADRIRERNRARTRARYHTDPEFRTNVLAYQRARYAKRRAEARAS